MKPIQVKALPDDLKASLPQFIRDLKAALSYVSFYSSDSPFVMQAVAKSHRSFQKYLDACGSLLLRVEKGKMFLNDADISEIGDLPKTFQEKNIRGFQISGGLAAAEMTSWMKQIMLPVNDAQEINGGFPHIQSLPKDAEVVIWKEEIPTPSGTVFVGDLVPPAPGGSSEALQDSVHSLEELMRGETFPLRSGLGEPGAGSQTQEALLSFVAEAWQYSQQQKKNISASPEMAALTQSFDKLFDRLLDRMEKSSPEFSNIRQWFNTPEGRLLDSQVASSMVPLVEAAVQNGWTAVLFDPATEGLVGECLAYWGANGKEELVEKTVECLAEKLSSRDGLEKQLALAHLMDARPWVRNTALLQKVLDGLYRLLAQETSPGLYQAGLLLAWDLLEPALAGGAEEQALNLLSILHFHSDEDSAAFPERPRIARQWLFERSTPDLIRHLVYSASKAGRLKQYPLLGEMAAPLLVEGFFAAPSTEKSGYLWLFGEMKEPVRSVLAERLAGAQGEEEVRRFIPILRVSGSDPALALQLSAWISRGSRELKLELLQVLEETGDPGGGPALRLALFDDSEEIAAMAARIIGKIRFAPGLPVLLKAAKIREGRYPQNDNFLVAVCQSLGMLAAPEGASFLEDIARKKPLLRGKNFSMPVRLAAVEALSKINQPKVWTFLGSLMEEKNPTLQEALDKIIHDRIQKL